MSQATLVSLQLLPHAEGLNLPQYATALSAGVDLEAAIDTPMTLKPGERALVPTGLAMALPAGFEAQIRPRSGLAFKNGVTVLNSPGTIDADYRGEVKVLLVNLGQVDFVIERGMRIAQMIIAPFTQVSWSVVDTLDETARGAGGFGSTGVDQALKKAV
ncbi:MAG: dUTP diphosphatase [Alphaproteobacteria bacterium]|nr:dUTP diphosphatase [Alphaproteobacteria bacterium]